MPTEDTKDSLSLTDEDDEFDDENHLPELAGTLSKWTNYIHGWQDRYIALKEGTLSYYKSEDDTAFGCRGAISLSKSIITVQNNPCVMCPSYLCEYLAQLHEFDDCRLDVSVNDCLWYLRARNSNERQMWYDMLELHKQVESGYGSENSLNRHGSLMSLSSTTSLSTASTSSFKRGRGLKEKLAEMETFRDILCHQVDTLQSYFNACSAAVANHESVHDMVNDDIDDLNDVDSEKSGQQSNHVYSLLDTNSRDNEMINILRQHGAHAIDFKGESFTFKATTAGILATLSHCIELMGQREDAWRRRLEREVERRKRYEDAYRVLLSERPKPIILGGPDYEEGPHSVIHEEEFFDAVDATLDKLEKEEEKKLSFKKEKILKPPLTSMEPSHSLYNEINSVVSDHLAYSDVTVTDLPAEWVLIADEGEMKVYRMELEEDGIVVDPTKAVHTVRGITGHEMCYNFWDSTVRMEWEGTLESTELLEWLSKDTVISHQIHKRVWPSTQRDSLFWSTIRHFPSDNDEGPDCWIVVNHDTPHKDVPLNTKFVRMRFNIAMICQTVVQPPDSGEEIKRENLSCRIQYSANVNPGGWAPASVVRMISKRELPKFLKTFTTYVQEKVKDQPIMF